MLHDMLEAQTSLAHWPLGEPGARKASAGGGWPSCGRDTQGGRRIAQLTDLRLARQLQPAAQASASPTQQLLPSVGQAASV